MAYDSPTTINGTAGIGEFLTYLNNVTNSWISNMIVAGIFIIFFAGYLRAKPEDFTGAFAVSSFATLVVSIFFFLVGFVNGMVLGLIIGLTVISSLILFLDKRQ